MKTCRKKLIFSSLAIILCISNIFARIKINKSTRMFIDENNRSNIFHGVNVVYKQSPYLPITENFDPLYSLNEEDIVFMKKMGFNLVRLGIIWESVEREEAKFDLEYLEKMSQIVNRLGESGIVTIVDAHQDMFSRIFCGEGVPIFYAQKLKVDKKCNTNLLSEFYKLIGVCLPLSNFNWEYEDNGIPKIEYCRKNFLKYHQSPELTTAYQAFYENQHGLQDKFVKFWTVVAEKFKDNPYIIGLDLWNEPWPGNLFMSPKSFIPGYTDKMNLIPFYRKIDKEIRKINPNFIIMLETVPFPDTLPFFGGYFVGGFEELPLGEDKKEFQALNLHSYCCMARSDACSTGEPLLKDTLDLCPSFHKRKLHKNKSQADKLGVPLLITEFGACSNSEACFNEMKGFMNAADETLTSWAYWMYKPYGDHTTSAREDEEGVFSRDGSLQAFKEKALTRTYVQAYQGVPLSAYFDYDTGYFFTSFAYDSSIHAPSVLYMNKGLFYKNFDENFIFRVYDKHNKNLKFEISEYRLNEKIYENYFNIRLNEDSIENSEVVYFAIIPNRKIDLANFDKSKKIDFKVEESTNSTNTLKIVDSKNLHTNLRIDVKVVYFIQENFIIKHFKINQKYTISEEHTFIKKLIINTEYGKIKIENLSNNQIEVHIR